jgi:hypothetical protein
VAAFYTSNVEQYLSKTECSGFAENVRKLPINEKSLFIRAVPNTRFTHPAQLAGHRITTLLQQLTVFLKDFDEGRYQTYSDLVLTHYIAPESPQVTDRSRVKRRNPKEATISIRSSHNPVVGSIYFGELDWGRARKGDEAADPRQRIKWSFGMCTCLSTVIVSALLERNT